MKHYSYRNQGTCSRMVSFDLDEQGKIHNVSFEGGCNGNLKAISKLVEGEDANKVKNILRGNTCGPRSTSCADQFSHALEEALNNNI